MDHRPRPRLLPTVFLLSTLATFPAVAQDAGGGPGMPGRGMGRGAGFDPVVLEGPPAPERFDSLVSLNPGQKGRYTTLYQNLMSSTRGDRDEIARRRQAMREARGSQDRSAMRDTMGDMRERMQTLRGRQEAFDQSLKEFLTPDQLKRYDDWREARRKEAREAFQRRLQGT